MEINKDRNVEFIVRTADTNVQKLVSEETNSVFEYAYQLQAVFKRQTYNLYDCADEAEQLTYYQARQISGEQEADTYSEELLDEDGNCIGNAMIVVTFDSSGNRITKRTETDLKGNVTSTSIKTDVYSSDDKLVETTQVTEYSGGEKVTYNVHVDSNENITKQSMEIVYPDGSRKITESNFSYNEYDPSVIMNMSETEKVYDEKGILIVEGVKKSGDFINYLVDIYNSSLSTYGVNSNTDLETIKSLLINLGIEDNINELNESWENTFLTRQEKVITTIDKDVRDSICEEIEANINLYSYDDSFIGGAFHDIEKSHMLKRLERVRKEGSCTEIQDLYSDVCGLLYPDSGKHLSVDGILDKVKARKLYDSMELNDIKESMEISDDFDPAKPLTDNETSLSYGEMLLYQLYQVEQQYALVKDNMGYLDTFISFANRELFDAGTSEDDIEAVFANYKEQLKNLSNLEGDELLAAFKALTGREYSNEALVDGRAIVGLCYQVDNKNEEELMELSEELEVNIENAYVSSNKFIYVETNTPDGIIYVAEPNPDYGVVDYDKLKVLLKQSYMKGFNDTESMGASNSTPGASLDDYQGTVVEQRKFAIDLARTAAVAITSMTGAGIIACGVTGAMVEGFGAYANYDGVGDSHVSDVDILTSTVSGFISGAFQGRGDKMTQWLCAKCGLTSDLAKQFMEKVVLKGVTSNVLKTESEYCLDYMLNYDEKTQQEKDDFWKGFFSEGLEAGKRGLIVGLLLMGTGHISKKFKNDIKDFIVNVGQDGVTDWKDALAKVLEKGVKVTLDTGARSYGDLLVGRDVDIDKVAETGMKEFVKNIFKR